MILSINNIFDYFSTLNVSFHDVLYMFDFFTMSEKYVTVKKVVASFIIKSTTINIGIDKRVLVPTGFLSAL